MKFEKKLKQSGNPELASEEYETIIHCKCPDGSFLQIVEKGKVVIATETKDNTSQLGLDKIGLGLTKSRHIAVNEKMETNLSNIYAGGDVTNTPAFVYTAAFEGKIAVEKVSKLSCCVS